MSGGAWSHGCLAGRRKKGRVTLLSSVFTTRKRHVHIADVELLVEVGEFASGILQKTAAQGQRKTKQIDRKHSDEEENRVAVGMEQNGFIGGHEFQLVEGAES